MGTLAFGDSLLAVYTIIKAIARENSKHFPYFLETPVCSVAPFYIHLPNIFQLVAMGVLFLMLYRKPKKGGSDSSEGESSQTSRLRMTDTDNLEDEDFGDEVANSSVEKTSVQSMEVEKSRRRNSWELVNTV